MGSPQARWGESVQCRVAAVTRASDASPSSVSKGTFISFWQHAITDFFPSGLLKTLLHVIFIIPWSQKDDHQGNKFLRVGGDPSLLEKRLSEDSPRYWLLQKWASMSSADAAEAEAEPGEEKAAAAAGENPLVFLCSRCRRPLGHSLTWVTSQEDSNCILLRCVSSNVSVDKEQKLSKCKGEDGCILGTLYCTGCSLRLGYVYRCTPKNLDSKRDLFCLSVEAIESYTLGSSEKQIVSEDKELLNLESRVEIEKSVKQMEDVLKALLMKLWEIELKLSSAGCCH
ncbi:protein Mis18-alpha-like [Peromyscus leucopus]|uniref:protein Mis18-alpha-like n=1 Tax=Peromyscus leucopus TaxID=10041 RepID=UPI001884E60F|nr:protein Mis18-alpha-like [Peromyscus leucopus]